VRPTPPPNRPAPADFLAAATKLASDFGWKYKNIERENETICVAKIENDPFFERFVWIFDSKRNMVRCLLIASEATSKRKIPAILEVCARINEGLPFGCSEFAFRERVVVFRDSTDLDWGPLDQVIEGTTSRTLNLGRKYAKGISAVLKGASPEDSIALCEEN
jgi:hypothetical protein